MTHRDPSTKWQSNAVSANYAGERFGSARAAGRDGRLVERLLARHAPGRRFARALDVPCGTGRLANVVGRRAERCVAADVSPAMLGEALRGAPNLALRAAGVAGPANVENGEPLRHATPPTWLAADGTRLPFEAGAFDLVVCCRLLHHLDGAQVAAVARELVRVGSDVVLASFWDAGSFQGWRRRAGLRDDPEGRRPTRRASIIDAFERAGAEVLGFAGSARYWSMQTFVAARVRGGAR